MTGTGVRHGRNAQLRRMVHRQRPRYVFLTWGRERSSNDYRHCSRIIACGVLRPHALKLAAAIAGQRDDLCHPDVTDGKAIDAVSESEQFVRLHQLIGRGTPRKVRNGVGGECHVRVYDQTDFGRFLGSLPGVDWKVLPRLRYVVGEKPAAKVRPIAERIVRFLSAYEEQSISVRKLKAELGLGDVAAKTVQRARDLALDQLPSWALEGRLLVRI